MSESYYKDEIKKLSSVEDLESLYWTIIDEQKSDKPQIYMCGETACQASGANDLLRVAKRYILENELQDKITLKVSGCHGFCENGSYGYCKSESNFLSKSNS
jgi:NADH-quinone oxidoreductase subunit F